MDTNEAKRIANTNSERQQAAAMYGWQFRPDAPELLQRWNVLPFNQIGDKRLAFGVLSGNYQGLPFTMFDYHRRPVVTTTFTRWTNKKMNEMDTITIDSVWVIPLPVALPQFTIVSSTDSNWDTEQYPEPPTHDPKFNRWYKLIDTNPQAAQQILTPQVMALMREQKLHTWSLAGNELLYVEHPIFGRTKPDEVVEALGKLMGLVSMLPVHQQPVQQHQQYQQPVQPQYQQPAQYQQPQYQAPQPQYYQQPQPQYYQQPQPQYGYPQPGYPYPPQGYPPNPYGPR
ncbi:hypothetical protein [Actinocrispum sp. NPDC049592]|uniref:hypothetical protein n=1 Tax=Actinocrispum sp. NPDC049592 TaxID=3154835 RepID=UPI0034318AFE